MALQYLERTAVGPVRGRPSFYRSAGEAEIYSGRRPDHASLAVATLMAGAGDQMTEPKVSEETVRAGLSESVLRGSAVTGVRHGDNAPFDADGPGTSDLDLTLVGAEAVALYKLEGFFIPKVHSRPVSEKDPDIAPGLLPLRDRLMKMVGRPVNIQGTRDWIMYVREHVMSQ